MNLIAKLNRKRRGVSPIIAAILLIGLAVLAGAAIYLVVIPMLTPTTTADQVTATMSGTASTDTNAKTITFTYTTANKGLKDVTVTIPSTGVAIGGTGVQLTSVMSGGSNVQTTGYTVKAGQTTDVTVIVTYSGSTAPTGAITVTVNIGNPVNSAKTFTLATV